MIGIDIGALAVVCVLVGACLLAGAVAERLGQ
jgi:hypothetical protein